MSKKTLKILGIITGVLLFLLLIIWNGKASIDRKLAAEERARLQNIETARTNDSLAEVERAEFKKFLNDIPVTAQFKNDDLQIYFSPFNFTNDFVFDRYSLVYSTSWFYRQAEREKKYIISLATVSSKSKNPLLPGLYVYSIDSSGVHFISQFEYRFYYWSDYGTYLGNYHENGNDFAYTETIKFDLGTLVDENYTKLPLLIIASNEGHFIRETDRFGNPPIQYRSQFSSPADLSAADLRKNYSVIQIINKGKIEEIKKSLNK